MLAAALGERIKECRQAAGMSQEKMAELVGVSRQAVTKWEAGQSAPSTENLFKLAELFGTTAGSLLTAEAEDRRELAEQMYALCKAEEEKSAALKRQARKRNIRTALLIALAYLAVYLTGRIVWCDPRESSLLSWLFTAKPDGAHSYLYGWLLSSRLFWYALFLSALPSLWGRLRFSVATAAGSAAGLAAGMLFGPYPEGAAAGHGHYGWAIWGAVYLLSIAAGIAAEKRRKKSAGKAP